MCRQQTSDSICKRLERSRPGERCCTSAGVVDTSNQATHSAQITSLYDHHYWKSIQNKQGALPGFLLSAWPGAEAKCIRRALWPRSVLSGSLCTQLLFLRGPNSWLTKALARAGKLFRRQPPRSSWPTPRLHPVHCSHVTDGSHHSEPPVSLAGHAEAAGAGRAC